MTLRFVEGYNTAVPYVYTYRTEYSPLNLQMAALAGGYLPQARKNFRFMELGCGQAYGVSVLAAMYPEAEFFGVDMMPEHIADAQVLADQVGLKNTHYQTATFREMLNRIEEFGDMDFVVMHGVYSWIDDENRKLLGELLSAMVRPGGIVYLSYNAMPGGAGTVAVQQLLIEHVRQSGLTGPQAAESAVGFALKMADAQAGFFTAHTATLERTKQVAQFGGNYVSHEFMHEQWTVLPFARVCRDMQRCGLNYAGPANYRFSTADLDIPAALRPDIDAATDPIWRETLIGYAMNTQFRADVYVNSSEVITDNQKTAALRETPVLLFMEPYFAQLQLQQDWGLTPEQTQTWMTAFARGPVRLGVLFDALQGSMEWSPFLGCLQQALIKKRYLYLARENSVDPTWARRLNLLTLKQNPFGARYDYLLYPQAGTAVSLGHRIGILAYTCQQFPQATAAELIERAMETLGYWQQTLQGLDQTRLYPVVARRELARFSYGFAEEIYPFLRRAGLGFAE